MRIEAGQKWRAKDGKHVLTVHGRNGHDISMWSCSDELGDIHFLTDEQLYEYCERVP